MSPAAPDRALRRIVAELAALHADDADAVLAELTAGERQTVEILLREYAGRSSPIAAVVPLPPAFDPARLSPWLVARLTAADGLTPHARQTLMTCAARCAPGGVR